MSKRTKTLLLALVILALLVGLFFAVKLLLPQDDGTASFFGRKHFDQADFHVFRRTVFRRGQSFRGGFVLRVEDGESSIDGLEGLPLDSDRISSVVSQATSMTAREMVEESPTSLGLYGLDNPVIL